MRFLQILRVFDKNFYSLVKILALEYPAASLRHQSGAIEIVLNIGNRTPR